MKQSYHISEFDKGQIELLRNAFSDAIAQKILFLKIRESLVQKKTWVSEKNREFSEKSTGEVSQFQKSKEPSNQISEVKQLEGLIDVYTKFTNKQPIKWIWWKN